MSKSFIGFLIVFCVVVVSIIVGSGCTMSKSGPHSGCAYFQQTRGHKAHVMRDRIYNPNDYRYKHDLHDTRGK